MPLLQAMEATNDGFLIAEADLESRGAGEVLGLQQSGVDADWRLARMPRDVGVLAGADEAARETVEGVRGEGVVWIVDGVIRFPSHMCICQASQWRLSM